MKYAIYSFISKRLGRASIFFRSLATARDREGALLVQVRRLRRELAEANNRVSGLEAAYDAPAPLPLCTDEYIARLDRAAMRQENN